MWTGDLTPRALAPAGARVPCSKASGWMMRSTGSRAGLPCPLRLPWSETLVQDTPAPEGGHSHPVDGIEQGRWPILNAPSAHPRGVRARVDRLVDVDVAVADLDV